MKTLPITILVYDGPIARMYLARLYQAGFRPAAILLMIFDRHPATGKPVAQWLPLKFRQVYAERNQEISLNYWPRFIHRSRPDLFSIMCNALGKVYIGADILIGETLKVAHYEKYTDVTERVFLGGLDDEILVSSLQRLEYKTVLFTGGGIIPRKLFDIPGIRYIHVHPGRLPMIRGADGLLWSMLVRGRPGASCFYMDKGLDTGEIILADDVPQINFDISGMPRPDDQILYRALFSYYDPLLRADFFVKMLLNTKSANLSDLPNYQQREQDGITYHFMNEKLRNEALKKLFIT